MDPLTMSVACSTMAELEARLHHVSECGRLIEFDEDVETCTSSTSQ